MARIDLDHIRHAYGPRPTSAKDYALKEVHHEWNDGGAYALLGPSGCGKTTLLNIISGLVQPSEGRILFDGVDVTHLPTEKRNIAQVFQFPVIYDTMTVYDNLAFPLRNRHVPAAEIDDHRVVRLRERRHADERLLALAPLPLVVGVPGRRLAHFRRVLVDGRIEIGRARRDTGRKHRHVDEGRADIDDDARAGPLDQGFGRLDIHGVEFMRLDRALPFQALFLVHRSDDLTAFFSRP